MSWRAGLVPGNHLTPSRTLYNTFKNTSISLLLAERFHAPWFAVQIRIVFDWILYSKIYLKIKQYLLLNVPIFIIAWKTHPLNRNIRSNLKKKKELFAIQVLATWTEMPTGCYPSTFGGSRSSSLSLANAHKHFLNFHSPFLTIRYIPLKSVIIKDHIFELYISSQQPLGAATANRPPFVLRPAQFTFK